MIPQAEVSGSSGLSIIFFHTKKAKDVKKICQLESLSNTEMCKLMYVYWSGIILQQLKVSSSSFHGWGPVYVLQDVNAGLTGVTVYTENLLMSPQSSPPFS